LKQACESFLSKSVLKDTVYTYHELSNIFNAKKLKNFCLKWILDNLEELWKEKADRDVLRGFLQDVVLQEMFQYLSCFFKEPITEAKSDTSNNSDIVNK